MLKIIFRCLSLCVICLAFNAYAQTNDNQKPIDPSSSVCNYYITPLKKEELNLSNIQAEFGIANIQEFQKTLAGKLKVAFIADSFPNAQYFSRVFETRTVNYLYDRVIFQADLYALSYLIQLTENTKKQLSTDALSAVAFIHFQLATDVDNQKGVSHIKTAIKGLDSYPATIFWGRAHVWGAPYTEKDLKIAMNYLAAAGRIPGERTKKNNRMDHLNTEEIQGLTLTYMIENFPDMPYREIYEPLLKQLTPALRLQEEFRSQFEKSADFASIDLALKELNAHTLKNETEKIFGTSAPADSLSGWNLLNAHLANQEQIASQVNNTMPLTSSQINALEKFEFLNQKLQTALAQTERALVFQQMAAKEEFPALVKRVKSLNSLQHALSRSCSLSETWQSHLKGNPTRN
jgi:hypothetical protein